MTTSDNLMTTSDDNLNPKRGKGYDNHDNLFRDLNLVCVCVWDVVVLDVIGCHGCHNPRNPPLSGVTTSGDNLRPWLS
jgi:hypothetical protein